MALQQQAYYHWDRSRRSGEDRAVASVGFPSLNGLIPRRDLNGLGVCCLLPPLCPSALAKPPHGSGSGGLMEWDHKGERCMGEW